MKQIDIIRTYAQKRCLIVDSVPDARAHLKRIMVDFGTKETDTVGNAEEAIDICQKRQYDLVISDYNLGQGKNGQQLLEELRYQHLLRNTALFIMITAENASHYVLHALEYEPDDFLQKPINRDGLRPRLDLALLKNEHLLKIKEALDDQRIGKAIAAAETIAATPHKFQSDAKKVLAELYLSNNQVDEALGVYQSLSGERLPLWAAMGKAKVCYQKKQYDDAEARLNKIIGAFPYFVEANDLLAKVYEQTHREVLSQQTLMNAVKISPRSAPRQRELGRVSLDIDDENTSIHAFRSAIRHAKNSCHESPNDHLNLANGLVKLAKKSDGSAAKTLMDEAQSSLAVSEKNYGKHPIAMMRNHLVKAEIADAVSDDTMATAATEAALEIHASMRYSALANTDTQLCIDCALAFMARGCYDEGETILQALAEANKDVDFSVKIDKLLREPKTKEGIAYAAKLNKEGIEFYERKLIDEAIRSFKSVLKELPNHIGLNLNLIQALISKNKATPLSAIELAMIESSFTRVGKVTGNESYFKRHEYLHKRYLHLKAEK